MHRLQLKSHTPKSINSTCNKIKLLLTLQVNNQDLKMRLVHDSSAKKDPLHTTNAAESRICDLTDEELHVKVCSLTALFAHYITTEQNWQYLFLTG